MWSAWLGLLGCALAPETVQSVVLDRFEGPVMVIEAQASETWDLPEAWRPAFAPEGAVLEVRVRLRCGLAQ